MFCDRRDREGGTIYVTEVPCWDCAKLVANSGLAAVKILTDENQEHRDPQRSIAWLRQCGLVVTVENHAATR